MRSSLFMSLRTVAELPSYFSSLEKIGKKSSQLLHIIKYQGKQSPIVDGSRWVIERKIGLRALIKQAAVRIAQSELPAHKQMQSMVSHRADDLGAKQLDLSVQVWSTCVHLI